MRRQRIGTFDEARHFLATQFQRLTMAQRFEYLDSMLEFSYEALGPQRFRRMVRRKARRQSRR